jgi:hypothetical protein
MALREERLRDEIVREEQRAADEAQWAAYLFTQEEIVQREVAWENATIAVTARVEQFLKKDTSRSLGKRALCERVRAEEWAASPPLPSLVGPLVAFIRSEVSRQLRERREADQQARMLAQDRMALRARLLASGVNLKLSRRLADQHIRRHLLPWMRTRRSWKRGYNLTLILEGRQALAQCRAENELDMWIGSNMKGDRVEEGAVSAHARRLQRLTRVAYPGDTRGVEDIVSGRCRDLWGIR